MKCDISRKSKKGRFKSSNVGLGGQFPNSCLRGRSLYRLCSNY